MPAFQRKSWRTLKYLTFNEKNKKSTVQIKKKSTAVEDYMLMCDQLVSFDDFKVLASSNFAFHLKIKECLLILRDQSILNKNAASLPSYIFVISYTNISQSFMTI